MINQAKKKAIGVIRGSKDNTKDIGKKFDVITKKRAPSSSMRTISKLDEVLFYTNMIKNGITVNTGEFEALTRIFTGQKMYVDTRDISVAPHLMLEGEWEREITTIFRKVINEGDIVFDIGANFGYFGVIAGTEIGSNGQVCFIEANKQLIPYIRKSISVNGLNERSKLLNIALSDKEGSVELQILEDYWGSSSVHDLESLAKSNHNLDLKLAQKQKIRASSLDIICKENSVSSIDVIKLDIEGYEETAYTGMKNIIKNSSNLKLFIEFTASGYKNPAAFFEKILDDFGNVYAITHEDGSVIEVKTYKEVESFAHGDWLMLIAAKSPLLDL